MRCNMEDQNQKSLEKITTQKPPVEEVKAVVEDIPEVQEIKPVDQNLKDNISVQDLQQPKDSVTVVEQEKSNIDSEEIKCDATKKPISSDMCMPKAEETASFLSAPIGGDNAPTPRRLNKLRDHASTVFPAGCMGCPESNMPENVASPRRFLDAMEAKEHAGLIDNTPKKRPNSAIPAAFGRNPLTGAGVDMEEVKKSGARRKDGNPLLGEGYECDSKSITGSNSRIPPGGYSKGLW